ncbi:MAG: hypothetical protein ACOYOE_06150 [Chlorobium sp.]
MTEAICNVERIFSRLGWNNPLRYQRVGNIECLLGYQDQGHIFLELKRREKEIYFFKDKSECDFIVKQGFDVTEAIQVSATLSDANTRHRELRGLTECCNKFGLRRGLIITLNGSEDFEHHGIAVTVMPLWRWLLL